MMLDKHKSPRRFWTNVISTACYISNRIFLRSILNLTPFKLRFGRKSSVSHLRHFDCKCFMLKRGNLDKFESHSSDGILLDYTPLGRSYRVFNLQTNIIIESYDVTFDETAPCPRHVFECVGDKEMVESIFIDEKLHVFNDDGDEPLLPSTSSLELVQLLHLKQRLLRLLPLTQQQLRHHGLRGRSSLSRELLLTFRRHIHLNRS
jgi:hypothetical protein